MTPPTRNATWLEAAALLTDHMDDLVVGSVRDVHTAVSGRVHGLLDRLAGGRTAAHRVHDAVAALVHASVGSGLRATSRGLRAAERRRLGGPALEETPAGRFLLAVVNGLIGDRLTAAGSVMAIEAGVRTDGADVALEPEVVAARFADPTEALVVFVHGLCESEEAWHRAPRPRRPQDERRDPPAPSYGDVLAVEAGWSPVYVRANTGLPVAESGVALSALLSRLVQAWPTEVRRIALVGHSMGGLIARSACGVRTDADRDWKPLVTDVVTLGTPHLGSPVERVIERGMHLARRVPELAPYSRVLGSRSAGVLDLHDGMPEDVAEVPGARYHLVAATLTASPDHPAAGLLGDYLVPYASAVARPRGGAELFPGADVLHVPGADHFDLLNHAAVRAALLDWLGVGSDSRGPESAVGEHRPPTHGNEGAAV